MSYRIGSFNMFKFNLRSDNDVRKNFSRIAQIIRDQEYDIVALQEVLSQMALQRLLMELGPMWEGRWAQPLSRSSNAAEGYAFVWNKMRIQLARSIADGDDLVERIYEPRIFNQHPHYRILGIPMQLTRAPFYGRFSLRANPKIEIRLLNTHIAFSGSGDQKSAGISDTMLRKNEFQILARGVYRNVSNRRYGDNDTNYTILLGDYNLNLESSKMGSPYVEELIEIQENGKVQRLLTVQNSPSTLKKTIDENNSSYWANNYDHFTFDADRFRSCDVEASSVDTVRDYCNNDPDDHRKTISDHTPITMKFDIN